MNPLDFAIRQRVITETLAGHAAHQAFDDLCCEVLRSHGYDPTIFERAAAVWHDQAQPYPRSS